MVSSLNHEVFVNIMNNISTDAEGPILHYRTDPLLLEQDHVSLLDSSLLICTV
jgi:hypothetical protein